MINARTVMLSLTLGSTVLGTAEVETRLISVGSDGGHVVLKVDEAALYRALAREVEAMLVTLIDASGSSARHRASSDAVEGDRLT